LPPLSSWGLVDFLEMCQLKGVDLDSMQDILAHMEIFTMEDLRNRASFEQDLKLYNVRHVTRHHLLEGLGIIRRKYPPPPEFEVGAMSTPSMMSMQKQASRITMSGAPSHQSTQLISEKERHALADLAAEGDFDAVFPIVEADPRVVNLCRPGGTGKWTMLHQAASFGNAEACQRLLELRANPTLKNSSRQTPADVAEDFDQEDVMDLLRVAEETWKTSGSGTARSA